MNSWRARSRRKEFSSSVKWVSTDFVVWFCSPLSLFFFLPFSYAIRTRSSDSWLAFPKRGIHRTTGLCGDFFIYFPLLARTGCSGKNRLTGGGAHCPSLQEPLNLLELGRCSWTHGTLLRLPIPLATLWTCPQMREKRGTCIILPTSPRTLPRSGPKPL